MVDGFGKYDVYAVAGSNYCYTGTNVLKNRFGIRDNDRLKALETDITAVRQNDLLLPLSPGASQSIISAAFTNTCSATSISLQGISAGRTL